MHTYFSSTVILVTDANGFLQSCPFRVGDASDTDTDKEDDDDSRAAGDAVTDAWCAGGGRGGQSLRGSYDPRNEVDCAEDPVAADGGRRSASDNELDLEEAASYHTTHDTRCTNIEPHIEIHHT